ncbi:hypothetical protein [Actinoplanes sp. GCM10030250]|uniref:hypothetical protein n=1 Tax=Actinoplanes sp. GCM10030250 TaxID=3273376 RepID=UPI00361F8BB4
MANVDAREAKGVQLGDGAVQHNHYAKSGAALGVAVTVVAGAMGVTYMWRHRADPASHCASPGCVSVAPAAIKTPTGAPFGPTSAVATSPGLTPTTGGPVSRTASTPGNESAGPATQPTIQQPPPPPEPSEASSLRVVEAPAFAALKDARVGTCQTGGGLGLAESVMITPPADGYGRVEFTVPDGFVKITVRVGVSDGADTDREARTRAFVEVIGGERIFEPEQLTYGTAQDVSLAVAGGQKLRMQASAGDRPEEVCFRQPTLHR